MLIKPSGVAYDGPAARGPRRGRARRRPGRRGRPASIVRHADPPRPLPPRSRRSAASSTPTRRPRRRGRRPAARSRRSGRRTPTISTGRPGHPPAQRPEVAGDYEAATGAVIVEALDDRPVWTPWRCRRSWSRRTGRSPGVRIRRRPPTTRSRSRPSRRWPSETLALDPDRQADGTVAARPPLPAQARRHRLLRAAAVTTADDRRHRRRRAPPWAGRHPAGSRSDRRRRARARSSSGSPPSACAARTCTGIARARSATRACRDRSSSVTSSAASSWTGRGPGSASRPTRPTRAADAIRAAGVGANVCIATRFAGFGTTDGALRSVMAWPGHLLHRVPDSVGDDEAALLEPLGVALHALDLAPITVGAPGRRLRLRTARVCCSSSSSA